ncbi:MAG: hypothetical protein HOC78_02660 [Candidatus Komeilibacteria bacterium]|jgi:hypothetical protein|nr:hypothetical protein [Candidatus Komeilibacteria bacterium]
MKLLKILILIFIIAWAIWFVKFAKHYAHNGELKRNADVWGVTFSTKFVDELGLNVNEVYTAMLDDLQVKQIRLPIYWDQIEKNEGEFNFSVFDELLAEGVERDVKFVANLGWRLPRWPECHAPTWTQDMPIGDIQNKTFSMLKIAIDHYKDHPEIVAWQIENEPLVDWFGDCPAGDEEFLKQEVELVKSLDDRPIIISASGELSMWKREAEIGDVLATTLYRVVWNPWFKYFRYPLPASFYNWKAERVDKVGEQMIISELQAEPWVPNGTLAELPDNEINKSFDLRQMESNLQFAQKINFSKNYLWGVEWWYLRKINGDDSYWNLAKQLF